VKRSSKRFGEQIGKLRRGTNMRKRNEAGEVLLTNEMTVDFDMFRSFMKHGVFSDVDCS